MSTDVTQERAKSTVPDIARIVPLTINKGIKDNWRIVYIIINNLFCFRRKKTKKNDRNNSTKKTTDKGGKKK